MTNLVDVIIPTFNNPQYLDDTIYSLLKHRPSENLTQIYIINNGHPLSCKRYYNYHHNVTVLETGGENFGWMKAINFGIKKTKAPFVCMCNDDIYVPKSSLFWLNTLLQHFADPKVGGVGPSSNMVMGYQNIFNKPAIDLFTTKFLIGFCVLYRREAIEDIGLLDENLPGGDDLDYAIRMNDKGWKLLVNREVFIFHHGFKTGNRVAGDHTKKGGWNSAEYQEIVNTALIKKHGFRKWYETIQGAIKLPSVIHFENKNTEGEAIKKRLKGKVIVDVGCGGKKTVRRAIGIDMIPKGKPIDTLAKILSVADIVADVSQSLPFENDSVDCIIARHILEHLLDPIKTILMWREKLKKGGQLIIAVPDNAVFRSIPMNIEHLHGWDRNSMKTLLEVTGFKIVEQLDSGNNMSFVSIGEKL